MNISSLTGYGWLCYYLLAITTLSEPILCGPFSFFFFTEFCPNRGGGWGEHFKQRYNNNFLTVSLPSSRVVSSVANKETFTRPALQRDHKCRNKFSICEGGNDFLHKGSWFDILLRYRHFCGQFDLKQEFE